jgi:hypothetical protein
MRRIVYLSTATRLMSDADLLEVLRVSRVNNARDGVTGMLLYQGGNFIQLLEGEPAAIDTVYARIDKDPRHHSVLRMLDGEAEERLFADWSMAFRPADSLSAELKNEVADFIARAPQEAATNSGRRALRLIDSFIQSMR